MSVASPALPASTATVLHVVPRPDGDWAVQAEAGDEALSIHLEATAAVRAAVDRAHGTPRRDAGR